MAKLRKNIVNLARMLTDCMDAKYGLVKMDESRPEYWMLDKLLTDDQAAFMLKLGKRKPATFEEIIGKTGLDEENVRRVLDELTQMGLVEFNYHNERHEKQYVVPVFVVGSCENLVLNKELAEKHPEVAEFFYQMSKMPLELISGMVPPGGAGLGFHAIPVEKSIPHKSEAVDIEYLSFWLDKYKNQLAVTDCCCRKAMIMRGEGCGELPDKGCILLGDYADYMVETGRAEKSSYEEIIALLKRSEDNGFMHQITNGDGGNEIFAICNCSVGNCFALRCSQLFNNQNLSASAYRAFVDTKKCAACGKCVEVCPAGAVRLGRKLHTKEGPYTYDNEKLASESITWGKSNWHEDYRERNQLNCYECGTSPCKAACPAHVSVQGVLELYKQGRYLDALKLLRMDNPFPSLCESSCMHNCEKVCMRKTLDYSMEISAVISELSHMQEKYIDELIPQKCRRKGEDKDYEQKVAVTGGGYDSLSCAYFLAVSGYPVTVFADSVSCSSAEKDILIKTGVVFSPAQELNKNDYDALYPDMFGTSSSSSPALVEDGRSAAESIHRSLHPGHSQDIARNMRKFKALDRNQTIIPVLGADEHTCLSCGAAYVDPNRCIGCGICTTRCLFDAITIKRTNSEFVNYCTADSSVRNIALNGMKNIAVNAVKKTARGWNLL